jgi:hypothetical protein
VPEEVTMRRSKRRRSRFGNGGPTSLVRSTEQVDQQCKLRRRNNVVCD